MNLGLGGPPSFLSGRHGSEGSPLSLRSCKNDTLPLSGVPRAGVCRLRIFHPPSASADRAAATRGLRVRGRRRFRPRRRGLGGGVMAGKPPPPAGRRPFISAPRPAPTWLNQARLCLADPVHLDPRAALPHPAPPGLGCRDPAARASSLRFAREPGNPASNPPRARPAPWETAIGYDPYCSPFHRWET